MMARASAAGNHREFLFSSLSYFLYLWLCAILHISLVHTRTYIPYRLDCYATCICGFCVACFAVVGWLQQCQSRQRKQLQLQICAVVRCDNVATTTGFVLPLNCQRNFKPYYCRQLPAACEFKSTKYVYIYEYHVRFPSYQVLLHGYVR